MRNYTVFIKENSKILHLEGNTKTFDFAGLGKKYDLIFIDGDHSYEMVKHDTEQVFKHLVHDNSVVVWHDYAYNPEKFVTKFSKLFWTGHQKNFIKIFTIHKIQCVPFSQKKILIRPLLKALKLQNFCLKLI
jgi:hypothetical protein